VQRRFLNKLLNNGSLREFIDKIESYVNIISGPAVHRHAATPITFRMVESDVSDSPFRVRDTLTSRAEIGDLAAIFKDDVVAVIGVGGTGAYLLDFLAKTPVREIRAFDRVGYYVHNTFWSPGRLDP